jgi:excisionase family DNA binding protein
MKWVIAGSSHWIGLSVCGYTVYRVLSSSVHPRYPREMDVSILLTTADVAAKLCVSERTIRFWAECEQIPALRVGRHWRFHRAELEQWLAARSTWVRPSSGPAATARARASR